MRLIRHLLPLILSLAIPFAGYASVPGQHTPCPMQPASMQHDPVERLVQDGSTSAHAAAAPSCCNDDTAFVQDGPVCKTGQQCQSGNAVQLAPLALQLPRPDGGFASPHPSELPPDPTLAAIWRPPAVV